MYMYVHVHYSMTGSIVDNVLGGKLNQAWKKCRVCPSDMYMYMMFTIYTYIYNYMYMYMMFTMYMYMYMLLA